MSSNKGVKAQDAADRFMAAALSATKGPSRARARARAKREAAAAAAARYVNAYGQREVGPTPGQERREAKRQMYLMSTEKAARLGVRRDSKASVSSTGGASAQCQKCFQRGHWTYECKNERVYISRPSRTQILNNPSLKMASSVPCEIDNPDIVKEEKVDRSRKRERSKHQANTDSEGTSEASVFETDSESSVTGSDSSSAESSSSYSSSDSEDCRRRRRKQQKRSHRRHCSSSDSPETDTGSDSDSADKGSRRKSRRYSRRH